MRRSYRPLAMLAGVAVGLTCLTSPAGADRNPAAQNKAIVAAKFDAWSAGSGSPYELLADNASWTIEGNSAASKTYPSREAFMTEVIRPFNARMSVGLKPTIRSMTADDDRIAILFDASGTARDGKPYRNSYAWFFQMKEGRVVKASAFFDAIAFNDLWSRVSPTK